MSENKLSIVKPSHFRDMIETAFGSPIDAKDVAVVSFNEKSFSNSISGMDLTGFIDKMVKFNKANGITGKDVAIITTEQLVNDEISENIVPENKTTSRSKFGKK